MTIHITPVGDLEPHEESTTCKCQPRVKHVNGNMLVIHDAFDGRVGVEVANEILNSHPTKAELLFADKVLNRVNSSLKALDQIGTPYMGRQRNVLAKEMNVLTDLLNKLK